VVKYVAIHLIYKFNLVYRLLFFFKIFTTFVDRENFERESYRKLGSGSKTAARIQILKTVLTRLPSSATS
jgi:hypothetical protein